MQPNIMSRNHFRKLGSCWQHMTSRMTMHLLKVSTFRVPSSMLTNTPNLNLKVQALCHHLRLLHCLPLHLNRQLHRMQMHMPHLFPDQVNTCDDVVLSALVESRYTVRTCCKLHLPFGSFYSHQILFRADVLVAIDACFTQKRRKDQKDPSHRDCPRYHPDSVFLSEEEVEAVEEYVALQRAAKATRTTHSSNGQDDGFESGMKVPTSVLNDCGDSFKAADEKREKASTKYFIDTGLMALLCRHDRVLWLVNMVHAGERQHYALALIQRLFQHIPHEMTVGVLYDVGCQLHRSCLKWGFLDSYLYRIIFAISVFHAFGHQWPCQIIYHPRKCLGFGLTDGEGCERFWNLIRKLIPCLRVSGVCAPYHLLCFFG
jgi:hypothetical protein